MTTSALPFTKVVPALPMCDLCKHRLGINNVTAHYDAKSVNGPWGFMCNEHFRSDGIRLGIGFGQRLILKGQVY